MASPRAAARVIRAPSHEPANYRAALLASAGAHAIVVVALSRIALAPEPLLVATPTAEFVWVRTLPVPEPAPPEILEPPLRVAPIAPAAEPPRETREERVAEPPLAERQVEEESEPPATVAPVSAEFVLEIAPRAAPSRFELDELRQQAAADAVRARESEKEYLTFSIDDVVAPRPAPEPERKSIFDGTGATRKNGTSVGQQRTRLGRQVAALCNALTGGFSILGMGSFCGDGDNEPSGLFPEARPEILDLLPECVDTQPADGSNVEPEPEPAVEPEFPTVKCRLVPKVQIESIPR